jgi:hypothetical protein
MTHSGCPYLVCEKTAFRGSLDLTDAAPVSVIVISERLERRQLYALGVE